MKKKAGVRMESPVFLLKHIVEKVDQLISLCDELERHIEQSKKDSELLVNEESEVESATV